MTRLLVIILLGGILCVGLLSCKSKTKVATMPDPTVVIKATQDSSLDGNLVARGGRYHWREN